MCPLEGSRMSFAELPPNLPIPEDDGAADHLRSLQLPDLTLASTSGGGVTLAALGSTRTVFYCYPLTGRPDRALPENWDAIPGARGCTPQSCAFRDHHAELLALGARVFGVSTQDTEYQREVHDRLHLPFALLSDTDFALTHALRLPTFEVEGMSLLKRLTMIVRDGAIEHVMYPVFPSNRNAEDVIAWLREHPL